MVELKPDWRVRVGDDFSSQSENIGLLILLSVIQLQTYLCMAMMAVWSESKLMNPYPAGSPVNLLVITLMLTTPLSPIMFMAFLIENLSK